MFLRNAMHKKLNILISFSLVSLCVACSSADKPAFEYMPDMMDQISVKAQEAAPQTAVEGTVARNVDVYPYAADERERAKNALNNPLPRTTEVFARGKKAFEIYCVVCHGHSAEGDGTIVPKFPRPPSLLSDKIKSWEDGEIFHVISTGQNLMPSYASQTLPEERWAITHYLRALQRADDPKPSDVKRLEMHLKKLKQQQ